MLQTKPILDYFSGKGWAINNLTILNKKDFMAKSSNEIKQLFIERMGNEFGLIFNSLHNQLIGININFKEFETLFTRESRVKLLNKAAPKFAYFIQNTLRENIVLSIASITDSVHAGQSKSISLLLLPKYIGDFNIRKSISGTIKKLTKTSNEFRTLRNKMIAHKDFNRTVSLNEPNLYWPTLISIREFLKLSSELLNKISLIFNVPQTKYDSVEGLCGSLQFLYRIQDGLHFEELKMQMAKRGDNSLDNWEDVISD